MPGQGVLVGLAKSLEKLSSGFRINRAADDAAGLAISEGLRTQVGGNRQAVRNAQDGISLVQTAEGALNEVHSILQRMRVLAVQGATDSNSSEARANINTELNQLRDELERIGSVTNFNGTQLLDGSATGNRALKFQVGANGDANNRITVDLKDADVTAISKFSQEEMVSQVPVAKAEGLAKENTYYLNVEGKSIKIDLSKATDAKKADIETALQKGLDEAGFEGYIKGGGVKSPESNDLAGKIQAAGEDAKGVYTLTIDGHKYVYDASDGTNKGTTLYDIKEGLNQALKNSGYELELKDKNDKTGTKLVLAATKPETQNKQVDFALTTTAAGADIADTVKTFQGKIGVAHGKGFEFTVEDGSISFKRADGKNLDVDLAHSLTMVPKGKTLGTDDVSVDLKGYDLKGTAVTEYTKKEFVKSLTVEDHDSAQNLIRVLDKKIQSVSTARSNLGAVQNRFEHTITNLNVAVENLAASESRVRDTDMAQEMMQFTRNQILSQAGTSMLAQANQVPQGVLSLLR